jgi:hypothetical protein
MNQPPAKLHPARTRRVGERGINNEALSDRPLGDTGGSNSGRTLSVFRGRGCAAPHIHPHGQRNAWDGNRDPVIHPHGNPDIEPHSRIYYRNSIGYSIQNAYRRRAHLYRHADRSAIRERYQHSHEHPTSLDGDAYAHAHRDSFGHAHWCGLQGRDNFLYDERERVRGSWRRGPLDLLVTGRGVG